MSNKMLIVFYSWSNGNTERVAKMLQKITGADMAQIETVIPYTGSYDDVVQQGQQEVQRGYEPEIKPLDMKCGSRPGWSWTKQRMTLRKISIFI